MTEQELSELLSHPRVQAYIDRRAEQAAARQFAALVARQKRAIYQSVTVAEAGDLNYADAEAFIGLPEGSIRWYVTKGRIERGALPRTVNFASCEAFKRKYKPKPSGRTSG